MLKAFHLGVIFTLLVALSAIILARPLTLVLPNSDSETFLADEGTVRSERSANISHIISALRKIQIIVNRVMLLQISPDGTVSGTDDDNDYTILQRASVNNYQIKLQSVATCQFLCMDHCGLLYGSRNFTDECIFNEMIESHHFNSYSSAKYSNEKRTLYLALNKKGLPRKVQIKANTSLGKLETYTNVLTKPVSTERVEALVVKIIKARVLSRKFLLSSSGEDMSIHHSLRHHGYHQLCANVPFTKLDDTNKYSCRKREKRKKKRKCREDEDESDECQQNVKRKPNFIGKKKCEEGEDEEECQKRLQMIRKKRKSRNGESESGKKLNVDEKKRKRRLKNDKKKFSEKIKCQNSEGNRNCLTKKSVKDKTSELILWKDIIGHNDSRNASEFLTKLVTLPLVYSTTEGTDFENDGTTDSHEAMMSLIEDETVTDTLNDWTTSSAVHD